MGPTFGAICALLSITVNRHRRPHEPLVMAARRGCGRARRWSCGRWADRRRASRDGRAPGRPGTPRTASASIDREARARGLQATWQADRSSQRALRRFGQSARSMSTTCGAGAAPRGRGARDDGQARRARVVGDVEDRRGAAAPRRRRHSSGSTLHDAASAGSLARQAHAQHARTIARAGARADDEEHARARRPGERARAQPRQVEAAGRAAAGPTRTRHSRLSSRAAVARKASSGSRAASPVRTRAR